MFSNYLKIAWRNFLKRKSYAGINIFGLSLGITACLLVFALIFHLKSYDRYHQHADYTFRVVTHSYQGQREYFTPGVPAVLPEAFLNDFKGITSSVFISGGHSGLITVLNDEQQQFFQENNFAFTSSDFFKVFDRKILQGTGNEILNEPNQVVISKRFAQKYFGDQNALNKILQLQKKDLFKVVAVMEDFPNNTDFPFDLFFSYENLKESREAGQWFSIHSDDQFYVVLHDVQESAKIEAGMPDFMVKYLGDKNKDNRTHRLQPLSMLHFDDRYTNYSYKTVSKSMITSLVIIAAFLMLTACINFINLSTALSSKRAKEVGLRKVFGGNKGQIISQFLSETGLIVIFAVVISEGSAFYFLGSLNEFLRIETSFSVFFQPLGLLLIFGLWIGITLLAGFYPSFSISSLNPIGAIKSQFQSKKSKSFFLRKGLVVFQFIITQIFIIGTLVLVLQMDYIRKVDLGFQKDAVLSFTVPESNNEKSKMLLERIKTLPGIENASLSYTEPASSSVSGTNLVMVESGEEYNIQIKPADENYVSTYGLTLLHGEDLLPSDSINRFLATESFAKKAGFENPEDLIGLFVKINGKEAPIVGVLKDFNTMSLRSEIEPTFLFNSPRHYRTLGLKVTEANANQVMEKVEKIYKDLYPEFRFEYAFLDERIAEFYEGEKRMTSLFGLFSCIAILVGCIGLYGLVSFLTAIKVKEIGVRKVMGASSAQILGIVSREYLVLLIISFILAAPLAAFIMGKWLENYAFRISISWEVFALALLGTILIAFITVGFKSLKAAWANPVDSLRSE